jgi:hypothetical protein
MFVLSGAFGIKQPDAGIEKCATGCVHSCKLNLQPRLQQDILDSANGFFQRQCAKSILIVPDGP